VTDNERSLIGRLGAHALHSKYDSRELTANTRARSFAKFSTKWIPNEAP
jgi:hypothetical protein